MATEFTQENADFSDRAHHVAKSTLYPKLFGTDLLRYTDKWDSEQDKWKGVDRIVWVSSDLRHDSAFTVQERFRRAKYKDYRELTATSHNAKTDRVGDYFKLRADYYVYGYLNEGGTDFIEAIAVNIPRMKLLAARGVLDIGNEYFAKKDQHFMSFAFDELIEKGCVDMRYEGSSS